MKGRTCAARRACLGATGRRLREHVRSASARSRRRERSCCGSARTWTAAAEPGATRRRDGPISPLQESVHDAFVDALVESVRKLRLGSGLDAATSHGPLIQAGAVDKVGVRAGGVWGLPGSRNAAFMVGMHARRCSRQPPPPRQSITPASAWRGRPEASGSTPCAQVHEKVEDAVKKGARVPVGGKRPPFEAGHPLAGGNFYEPTVVTGTYGGLGVVALDGSARGRVRVEGRLAANTSSGRQRALAGHGRDARAPDQSVCCAGGRRVATPASSRTALA